MKIFTSEWSGLTWRFVAQPIYGTLQVDYYQEQALRSTGQRTSGWRIKL